MQEKNLAYDLSLFDTAMEKEKNNIVELPVVKNKVRTKQKLSLMNIITMSLLSVAMITVVSTLVFSQVLLTELTENIACLTNELNEKQSIYTQLQMKADAKLSLKTVEEYSKNELGMSKIEASQIEYIRLSEGDKSSINTQNAHLGLFSNIKNLISDILS